MPDNARPTVAVTRQLPQPVMDRLFATFDIRDNPDDGPLDEAALLRLCDGADGMLCCATEKIDRSFLEKAPDSLKIVATFSVGYDHIDVEAAGRRGICITNTPDVLSDATAEVAMLLILAACRRAREAQAVIHEDRWGRWSPTFLLGMQLSACDVGFVGMGRIARRTADMLRPFGPKLRYWNRRQYDASEVGADIEFVADLDRLFETSNVITIHVPGGAETTDLVDAARIARMPRGSVIVNTARGNVIDDDALIAALQSGHLGGAGLDVFKGEPKYDRRYLDLPNVFMLPHIGSATVTARDGMGFRATDNLEAFLSGKEPRDRVV